MSTVNDVKKFVQRFDLLRRVEHWVLFVSFTTLALTGLPQKFPTAGISVAIASLFGNVDTLRTVHHVAASIFMLETVFHILVAFYKLFVERVPASMLPGIRDVREVIAMVLFNLGIRKDRPKMGRFNFIEKMEYWALIWGVFAMGLTGFMLWNPIATTDVLPGQFIPAAKIAHGWEAVLAVVAIILWHFYSVHLKHWNTSMFNGKIDRHTMEHEHAEELEQIDNAVAVRTASPVDKKKRQAIFYPIAAVFTIVSLGFIYWFVTLEQTSITTIEPVTEVRLPAYDPQTPTPAPTLAPTATAAPTNTPAPTATAAPTVAGATETAAAPATAAVTWDTNIAALFQTKCIACHGTMGGFDASTYASVIKGGASGPAISGNDPAASLLVQKFEAGGTHVGRITAEELELLKQWITGGALEK